MPRSKIISNYRVRYQTKEVQEFDIHLRTLRDNQQFSDDFDVAKNLGISSANWPLFGMLWESGEVLAHLMADFEIEGKRILEVGCGLGMASLVLNKRSADVSATDRHPEAEGFLEINVELNEGRAIPFFQMDWASEALEQGNFDLVIGSDLLYEQGHAKVLSQFINIQGHPHCEVVIVDPGRGHVAKFSDCMAENLFSHSKATPEPGSHLSSSYKGQIHRYLR